MSNEMIVQNGNAGETKRNPERALVSKIARLPKDVREEFNRRIEDGQPASEILPWVNALPAVKEILHKHFGGMPISEGNLCLWRQGGHKRWQEKQESEAEMRILAEDMKEVIDAGGGTLARGTASIVAAKILKMVHAMKSGQESIDVLMKVSYAVSALMNAEQGQARLEFEEKRVELRDEEVTLKWDKQQRDGVAIAQRALDDELAKAIQASDIDNGEKIELLGYQLYGRKWQGRKVGKKEEPKKEPEEPKNGSGGSGGAKGTADDETINQGLVPQPEEARPEMNCTRDGARMLARAPAPLPQERENDRPMVPKDERVETARTTVSADDEKAGTKETEETEARERAQIPGKNAKPEKPQSQTPPHPNPLPQGGEGEPAADQQVRPTATMGSITAAIKTATGKIKEKISGSLTTAATPKETDATQRAHACDPTTVKQKAPGRELSPYDKALLEGKTHLEAMYAQYTPDPNPKLKTQNDPSQPKPNPLDAFSEPVKTSPFVSLHGLLRRGSLWSLG